MNTRTPVKEYTLTLSQLKKSFSSRCIFDNYSESFQAPGAYCIMGPSGCGKTTLFRILCGLEAPDGGTIKPASDTLRFSYAFQEDRLFESLSAVDNLYAVLSSHMPYKSMNKTQFRESITPELTALLPADVLAQPVSEFSGGMKRRVSILRAMLAPSDVILLDEPFNGLDSDTKEKAAAYILAKARGKLLLCSTHQASDAALLHAAIITLQAYSD